MKNPVVILVSAAICMSGTVSAEFTVTEEGTWPSTWPTELEPLRKQSSTLEGGARNLLLFYEIPFTKRDDFEAAWPHILKVKSEGAPLILLRSPDRINAGVRIRCPSLTTRTNSAELNQSVIHLVVDGKIVDLNRIPLPGDTKIVDRRFNNADARRK